MAKLNNELINGQVSIFDLMGLTVIAKPKEVIKRMRFNPKQVWEANFFNEFEIGKEYDVIKEYENRCGTRFYKFYAIEREAWCELFEEIKE